MLPPVESDDNQWQRMKSDSEGRQKGGTVDRQWPGVASVVESGFKARKEMRIQSGGCDCGWVGH